MNIKEFRLSKGLSQPKLAEALGIGTSTIGGYESGRINPSEKVLAKIKEVFGVDLNAPAEAAKPAKEAKPAKKAAKPKAKKAETAEAKPAAPKKPARPAAKKAVNVVIQSAMGGEIALTEIIAKVGDVDALYIKPEENAAYWVKGEESGAVNLW